jgi:hypothetical protein
MNNTVRTSKFFVEMINKVQEESSSLPIITFCEDDFEDYSSFIEAIKDQIASLYEQNAVLEFHHKQFCIGDWWSINIKEMSQLALKHKCLVRMGKPENNYTWRFSPIHTEKLSEQVKF